MDAHELYVGVPDIPCFGFTPSVGNFLSLTSHANFDEHEREQVTPRARFATYIIPQHLHILLRSSFFAIERHSRYGSGWRSWLIRLLLFFLVLPQLPGRNSKLACCPGDGQVCALAQSSAAVPLGDRGEAEPSLESQPHLVTFDHMYLKM
jgi:hypothetical protein